MKNVKLIKDINSIGINFSSYVAQRLFDIKRKRLNKLGSCISIVGEESSFANIRTLQDKIIAVTTDKVFDLTSYLIASITRLLKKVDLSRISNATKNTITADETSLYNLINHLIIINKNHLIENTIKRIRIEKDKNLIDFITFDDQKTINEKQALLSKNEEYEELLKKYENLKVCTHLILDNNEIQCFYFKYKTFKQNEEFPYLDTIRFYSPILEQYKKDLIVESINGQVINYVSLYEELALYRSNIANVNESQIRYYYESNIIGKMITKLNSLKETITNEKELAYLRIIIEAYQDMNEYINNKFASNNNYKKTKNSN